MLWRLIIGEYGPNIQYISVVDNIVYDTLIRLPYAPNNQDVSSTIKAQCHVNKLFVTCVEQNLSVSSPLYLFLVQR